ncbi:hypothetical protein ZWY2020_037885 [Hordeum vulgare]|nr:hypothetical protein ZWY2020_037885 [Hordeum vulgare]
MFMPRTNLRWKLCIEVDPASRFPSSLRSCALAVVFVSRNAHLMPSRSSTSQKIWKRMQQFFLGIAPQNSSIHFQ